MCDAKQMAGRVILSSTQMDPHAEVLALMTRLARQVETVEKELGEYVGRLSELERGLQDLRAQLDGDCVSAE